ESFQILGFSFHNISNLLVIVIILKRRDVHLVRERSISMHGSLQPRHLVMTGLYMNIAEGNKIIHIDILPCVTRMRIPEGYLQSHSPKWAWPTPLITRSVVELVAIPSTFIWNLNIIKQRLVVGIIC